MRNPSREISCICQAYVSVLSANKLTTDRQREIAIRCSILSASCAKIGLIALIDEATGYQYERETDALQIKLRTFIAAELREWEKTFPDELWGGDLGALQTGKAHYTIVLNGGERWFLSL